MTLRRSALRGLVGGVVTLCAWAGIAILHAADYQTLLAAPHRLGGPATATDTTGGEDEEVRP